MSEVALRSIRKLAANNALANYRLGQAVIALPQSGFEMKRTSFFPSLKATLNHILTIDWFYVDALEGGTLGPNAWMVEEPFDAARELYAAQRQSDERLVAFCKTLTAEGLGRAVSMHRRSRIQVERLDDVLAHLFQHQTHHRGQAHAMLAGTAVEPPQLDEFIVADDAKFRVADLTALGWTEEDLGF